jgi:hypothetical protein
MQIIRARVKPFQQEVNNDTDQRACSSRGSGKKPAPPAVAMAIAKWSAAPMRSVFVFTISVGLMNFFGWPFFGGDAISPAGPFAQIDELAPLAAKRAKRIIGVIGFLLTNRALHGSVG